MNEQFPILPNYVIDHVISKEGGMGLVYFGVDMRNGFPVAIKQLYASRAKNPEMVVAFRMEANNYVYLKHPRITKLVDFVEYGNSCFIVMEFLEGCTLESFIKTRTGPMPDEVVVPMFMQILETIDYIHNVRTPFSPHGMLHLDIKPSNIMVKDDFSIKVMDMGISATFNDHLAMNKVVGTPAYMPPEQANKGILGRYTDTFALGVTLYAMLTARLPFSGETPQEIWKKISQHQYPPTYDYYPYVNRDFDPIIAKALNPDYRQRYQTCAEMAIDINNKIKIR